MDKDICPKCGSPLAEVSETSTGRKLQRCSTGSWNKETKQNEGCDYVEWINGTTEKTDELCPQCNSPLVLFTTNAGRRMKKCSTAGWDRALKKATGCTYVEWLKPEPKQTEEDSGGEEFLPPEPKE